VTSEAFDTETDALTQIEAWGIIESAPDVEAAVHQLRDLFGVAHLVYHSSKLGSSPSIEPYIRLTYPATWIKQYLQRGYIDLDPVIREGFLRTLPFDWSELTIKTAEEGEFLMDALKHGVGPYGLSIPLRSKVGHRGLFSISFSGSAEDWQSLRDANLDTWIGAGNRLHRRVIAEEFGEQHASLSAREVECLRWTALGKDAGDIAGILQISPHTVRDYLKSVRHKLDCVTSAQAVSKATSLGLLSLSDLNTF
jgi:DNA-binding CsgD family transcriptional regulator